jgi:hypothetical protein
MTFAALVLSLPTANKTARMRIWRALRALGCGVLRDGVYLLPQDAPHVEALAKVESEVKRAGGFAMTVELSVKTPAQAQALKKLFDRTGEYAALVSRMKDKGAGSQLKRFQRALENIASVDFYPGEAARQAREMLSALEHQTSHAEPRPGKARVQRLDRIKYRGRVWATRKSPWIDRLASAWLIRRFIDRDARFRWIERPKDAPRRAVGFDFDGAEFTHVGDRVTFEVLQASFGLDGDPALNKLAAAVHFLDVGGIPVAEASGLEMVLRGARDAARSDDELANAAAKVFDHAYAAYRNG